MSQSPDPHSPFESQYPELKIPSDGWKSNIPAHLLASADDQMKWLMQEMSKNTQATEFACKGVVDLSRHLRTLNGKTYRNEKGVSDLAADVETLKAAARAAAPLVNTLSIVRIVFSNKVSWAILGLAVLFLLGFNRDVLPAIWKAIFG